MNKALIAVLLCPTLGLAIEQQWIEHTYRNELDNPVKIITQYTQVTQCFVQPKKRRKVVSKKIQQKVAYTLEPHESKTVIIKGDSLSARRIIPGNIKVFDICEHDHAIVPKHNVLDRNTFIVSRNKRDKLQMNPRR